jgi:hypothetical protein
MKKIAKKLLNITLSLLVALSKTQADERSLSETLANTGIELH